MLYWSGLLLSSCGQRAEPSPTESLKTRGFTLHNWAPDPPLDRFVNRFWKTRWSLPEPFVQTIVTHPVVNLVVQADGSAVISGVHRNNDSRRLDGDGWALGAMFRPGGFRPFMREPLTSLTDRRVTANEVFGAAGDQLAAAIVSAATDTERIALLTDFLLARAPTAPTVGEQISELVEFASLCRPVITQVSELARRHGVSQRTLERRFGEHIGVSPKWVLDRYRLHATAGAALKPVTSWADVAQDLGYSDQAHLTSSFSQAFGTPPATYARRELTRSSSATALPSHLPTAHSATTATG